MKLLIITQTIDKNDPILGFFVRWVQEFAKHCEHIHALALNVREHDLPDNVTVHCLGKSEGKPKIVWLWRVWKLSWQLRHEYDAVFVHMNPEYVVYAGLLWRLLRKKIGLWYAHGSVNYKLKIATKITHKVFTSTKQGFSIETPKRIIVGQGIDTGHFKPVINRQQNQQLELITVGRISESKDILTLVQSCVLLKKDGITFRFRIVGNPQNEADERYCQSLKHHIDSFDLNDQIEFVGPIPQRNLPKVLHGADIFISAGKTGSLDKALLESLACGIPAISSNISYKNFIGSRWGLSYEMGSEIKLYSMIKAMINSGKSTSTMLQEVRQYICKNHSIDSLVAEIISQIQ